MKNLPARLIEDAADANLIASYRAHLAWQQPCESEEAGGVLAVAGGNRFPGPYKNLAVRIDGTLAPKAFVERAQAFFGPRDRKFSVVTRGRYDADLESWLSSAGYELKSESPCLLVEQPVAVRSVDDHVRIERFADLGHVRDAVAVSAGAFETLGLPVEEAHKMLARHDRLLDPGVAGFVAYVDGVPAATALTLYSEGAAGVYWVATLPASRGRGLGEVCTALATNAGFERGAGVVTLQASPMGLPIYSRMGYRRCDQLRRYRQPG
jgi:ribosomal protein S18 acetylase RimI-like enzyme